MVDMLGNQNTKLLYFICHYCIKRKRYRSITYTNKLQCLNITVDIKICSKKD